MELYEFQRRAINFALKKKSTYMMIDMGLGKTAIALKTIEKSDYPALVFAPLRVCYVTWPDEIKKWTPNLKYTILHGPDKNIRLRLKRDIYIINYEGLKWFYTQAAKGKFKLRKFFMVFDESSMLKSPSTFRFKTLAHKMYPIFSPYRMCLSGTPAPNGLHELWSQYYMLDKGRRLGIYYTRYRDRFFDYILDAHKTVIKHGMQKEIYKIISDITFRLDSKDYKDLPKTVFNIIMVKPDATVKKLYDKLEKDFFLDFSSATISVDSSVGMSSKLQQMVQGAIYQDVDYSHKGSKPYQVIHDHKVEALKELINTSGGRSILCPINFRFEYDLICKGLKQTVPIIYGKTSAAESIKLVRRWNKGEIPLLLCHPRSIGHGMNLQTGGHIICWFGLTWSLESYLQLNARLARTGQQNTVVIHHLIMQDTIDEVIASVLAKKDSTQQELLDAIKNYWKSKM